METVTSAEFEPKPKVPRLAAPAIQDAPTQSETERSPESEPETTPRAPPPARVMSPDRDGEFNS